MKNGPYTLVKAPEDYPGKKYRGKYVYEHHLVWWKETGEIVPPGCNVHHKNEIKTDNRFDNLEILSHQEHAKEHGAKREKSYTWLSCTFVESISR